jgi:hypothetical protein
MPMTMRLWLVALFAAVAVPAKAQTAVEIFYFLNAGVAYEGDADRAGPLVQVNEYEGDLQGVPAHYSQQSEYSSADGKCLFQRTDTLTVTREDGRVFYGQGFWQYDLARLSDLSAKRDTIQPAGIPAIRVTFEGADGLVCQAGTTDMAEALADPSTLGPQQCSAKFETAVQDRDPSATEVDDLKGVETAIAYLRGTYCAGGAS